MERLGTSFNVDKRLAVAGSTPSPRKAAQAGVTPLATANPETLGHYRIVRIGRGRLAIGHRPRLRSLRQLTDVGFTHILTVLSESEDPYSIRDAAQDVGLTWKWIPIGTTKTLPGRKKPAIRRVLNQIEEVIANGGFVYVHCSAGIHRTGMITATLLFKMGIGEADVLKTLDWLRPITAQDIGDQRLSWARSFSEG